MYLLLRRTSLKNDVINHALEWHYGLLSNFVDTFFWYIKNTLFIQMITFMFTISYQQILGMDEKDECG